MLLKSYYLYLKQKQAAINFIGKKRNPDSWSKNQLKKMNVF